jgi:LmeA-like phospholipid-binding
MLLQNGNEFRMYKSFLIAPILSLLLAAPSFSKDAISFPISKPLSRNVQKFTGVTMISQFIAAQAAQHVLHKKLGGHVKVRIRTWSLTDLIAGKVKSIDVKLKGCNYKGVPIGTAEISAHTPVWLRLRSEGDKKAGLREPLMLTAKVDFASQDVSDALAINSVASTLRGLRLDLPGLGEQQLQVLSPRVNLDSGKILVDATLVTAGAPKETGVVLHVVGTPALEGNDRVVLKDMQVNCPDIVEPEKFAAFVEQLLNPIVNFQRFDRSNFAMRLKVLDVTEKRVHAEGNILIAPRPPKKPFVAGEMPKK